MWHNLSCRVLKMQVYKNKYLFCEYKNIMVQIILIFSSIFDGESSLKDLSFVSGSIEAWSHGAPAGAFF